MKTINRALVTGGAGFVGSHLVDELLKRNIETFVLDDFSTGTKENLETHSSDRRLHILVGDVRNSLPLIPEPEKIDVVFHEAAIASVPKSIEDPKLVHDINVNMTLELMDFCVRKKIKRFVFASSAAVYGLLGERAANESLVCRPVSPYGAGKLSVENYLHAYEKSFGLEPFILRYFNIYGPRQTLGDYSGVITIFIDNVLNGVTPTIFGDGLQTRDFVNIKDIVQANMLAMQSEKGIGEELNVASGESSTILRLLETIEKLTGRTDLGHRFAPTRAGDVKNGSADIKKIEHTLVYKPKVSLSQGLAELISYTKEHSRPLPEIKIGTGKESN